MKSVKKIHIMLNHLQLMVWIKRSLRLLIRSAWLGVSGYLFGWGLTELGIKSSDHLTWLIIGIGFAFIPFIGTIFAWPKKKQLIWTIDRKLENKEQISTAWSAIKQNDNSSVVIALVEDVLEDYPRIRKQLLLHGWHMSRDLISLAIVLILFFSVYIYRFKPILVPSIPDVEIELLQPAGAETNVSDVFPGGILGIKSDTSLKPTGSSTGLRGEDNQIVKDYTALQKTLSEMGNNLSQMPGTQELGQSLQTGDLTDIASALEELTAHLSDLDTSTQEQLANEMSSSSQNISSIETEEIQTLSQDMDDVASQLQKQADETGQPQNQSVSSLEGNISAQEALDKVVSDLRTLANINVDIPGGGAGQGDALNQNGTTEPVTRIQGGSDVIELPTSANNQAGLLTPSHDQSSSDQQANESMNLTLDTGNEIINSSIIPSIYPWKLRYVVSKYFLNR